MSEPAAKLDYATLRPVVPALVLQRIALVCGILPMCVGVGCLILYAATSNDDFIVGGLITLVGGSICFAVGAICISIYQFQALRSAPEDKPLARRRYRIALIILVANFPL